MFANILGTELRGILCNLPISGGSMLHKKATINFHNPGCVNILSRINALY